MRVAIFSDVHGNLTALEAVLADIKQQAPDLIIFGGDLCVFGSQPLGCVELLRAEAIPGIYGNADEWINNDPLLSNDIDAEEVIRTWQVDDAIDWAWAQLEANDRAWLRTLPFHRRVSPTVFPRDDLFVVHANPSNTEDPIHPPEAMQRRLYDDVKQTDEDLQPLMESIVRGMVAFGHIHVPFIREWRGLILVNVASVSLPADGDTRAKYGLFDWDDEAGWSVEHRYVAYDIERELGLLAALRPPGWEAFQFSLREGKPIPYLSDAEW